MTYEYAFWYLLGVYAMTTALCLGNGLEWGDEAPLPITFGLFWPMSLFAALLMYGMEKFKNWRKL